MVFGNFRRLHAPFLALAVFALYAVSVGFGILDYDDNCYIFHNPYINGSCAASVPEFFVPGLVRGDVYIPVSFLFFRMLFGIFGASPPAFHFFSVFLFALAVVALYFLLSRIFKLGCRDCVMPVRSAFSRYVFSPALNGGFPAFAAALLYALLPCHVENVAWISAAGYSLSAVFMFSALFLFVDSVAGGKGISGVLCVVLFALSVLSQPAAAVMPLIALVWAFCLKRSGLGRAALLSIPLFLVDIAYMLLFWRTVSSSFRFGGNASFSVIERIAASGRYFQSLLFPVDLLPVYPAPSPLFLITLAAVAAVFIVLLVRLRDPLLLFSGLWFVAAFLPYSNAVSSLLNLVQDRYLFFPSVGWCIGVLFLILAASSLLRRRRRLVFAAVFSAVVLFWSVCSFSYEGFWRTDEALWSYSYSVDGSVFYTAVNYGGVCVAGGRFGEALSVSSTLVRSHPDFYEGYKLGIVSLMMMGRNDEAYGLARILSEKLPAYYGSYMFMGDLDLRAGRYDSAEKNLERAEVLIQKDCSLYYEERGRIRSLVFDLAYMRADLKGMVSALGDMSDGFSGMPAGFASIGGDFAADERLCMAYLGSGPHAMDSRVSKILHIMRLVGMHGEKAPGVFRANAAVLGDADRAFAAGDYGRAEKIWNSVLSSDPFFSEVSFSLGVLLLNRGDRERGIALVKRALLCDPSNAAAKKCLDDLGGGGI